jgi:ABC-type uncharacterized transport system ATPase subunit
LDLRICNEISLGEIFGISGNKGIGKKEVIKTLSDFIKAEMEKPVLARINRAREKAG